MSCYHIVNKKHKKQPENHGYRTWAEPLLTCSKALAPGLGTRGRSVLVAGTAIPWGWGEVSQTKFCSVFLEHLLQTGSSVLCWENANASFKLMALHFSALPPAPWCILFHPGAVLHLFGGDFKLGQHFILKPRTETPGTSTLQILQTKPLNTNSIKAVSPNFVVLSFMS